MKIKIIRNKRYAAIQLEDKRHAEDLLTMARQQQKEIEMTELPLSVFALAGGTIGEVKFGPKNREGLDIEVET